MSTNLPEKNKADIAQLKKDIVSSDDAHKEIMDAIAALDEKVTPVVDWFKNITFGKRAIMWLLTIVGSIVAIAIGLRSLLTK